VSADKDANAEEAVGVTSLLTSSISLSANGDA
jgi:hypothetical protein